MKKPNHDRVRRSKRPCCTMHAIDERFPVAAELLNSVFGKRTNAETYRDRHDDILTVLITAMRDAFGKAEWMHPNLAEHLIEVASGLVVFGAALERTRVIRWPDEDQARKAEDKP